MAKDVNRYTCTKLPLSFITRDPGVIPRIVKASTHVHEVNILVYQLVKSIFLKEYNDSLDSNICVSNIKLPEITKDRKFLRSVYTSVQSKSRTVSQTFDSYFSTLLPNGTQVDLITMYTNLVIS